MTNQNNPIGSVWNKWDLHVHTPGTKKANQFLPAKDKNWQDYYEKLESSDVMVFGITDYFSFDTYMKVRDEFHKKYPDSKKVFFPNIELNLDRSSNGKNDGYNVHLIFDNVLSDELLNKFLQKLELDTKDDKKASITASEIPTTSSVSFESAYTTKEKLENAINQSFGVEKRFLVATVLHGHRSMQPDTKNGVKPEIAKNTDEQITDIFFGCDEKDYLFGLNKNKVRGNAVPKPVVTGCDAHSFDHVDNRLGKAFINNPEEKDKNKQRWTRPTWIKADLTFSGLQQIIFEPEERVKIQDENPYKDKVKIYFNSIDISGSTQYIIPDLTIPLNRELVTLIGGRGSGKSALLDTFAFLNEEHLKSDRNGKKKIVEYYRTNEAKLVPPPSFVLKTKLIDKDEKEVVIEKNLSEQTQLELPFLYLGQESLSSISTNDSELTKTICDLVGIDVNEIKQQELISHARSILSEIVNTNKQIESLILKYRTLGFTGEITLEKWIKEYVVKLVEQQKRLSSKETRKLLEDINKNTEKGLKLKDLQQKTTLLYTQLQQNSLNDEIQKYNNDLLKIYPSYKQIQILDSSKLLSSLNEIKTKTTQDMDDLRKKIIELKQKLINQGIKEDVNTLLQASENLQRQISNTQRELEEFERCLKIIKTLYGERKDILDEISQITTAVAKEISTAFITFQSSRKDSTKAEADLFEKMIEGVGVEGAINFDIKLFTQHILQNYVDNRRIPNETELKRIIAGENSDGLPIEISFDILSKWIQSDLSNQKYFSKGGLDGITEYIFTQWPSFLRVRAIAKLNNKPTDILSIGQRGTLLLKVYLATASAKQIFIIDQPEDNLDNNFIMNELVPLIRNAKKSRQIIMSTHNANLVVNTDAEQIIVAKLDQNKGYVSGSLENQAIIDNVCEILEGGEIAFKMREQKYHISA